jgi:hypothetical protein
MNNHEIEADREVGPKVRLRKPDRWQVQMVCRCPDEWVPETHEVRRVAALVDKKLVQVKRISQDGVRVRASAGAGSFRREARLAELLEQARRHVEELRRQADDPEHAAAVGSRRPAARRRAAREREARLEQAIAELPELKKRPEEAARRAGHGECGRKIRAKELRVSTTDPEARVMKMPNGGFNPAVNVQRATDTESRAVVGVEVTNEGTDSAGLSEPLREQVEQRTGQKVEQPLLDGGYLKTEDLGTGRRLPKRQGRPKAGPAAQKRNAPLGGVQVRSVERGLRNNCPLL